MKIESRTGVIVGGSAEHRGLFDWRTLSLSETVADFPEECGGREARSDWKRRVIFAREFMDGRPEATLKIKSSGAAGDAITRWSFHPAARRRPGSPRGEKMEMEDTWERSRRRLAASRSRGIGKINSGAVAQWMRLRFSK